MPFNEEYKDTYWKISTIKNWLNHVFLDEAFTNEELNRIQNTKLPDETVFADTVDTFSTCKVFLLSKRELIQYFPTEEERRCAPTEYALHAGVTVVNRYPVEGGSSGWWYLRSPGCMAGRAAYVLNSGRLYVDMMGYNVSDAGGVRPAMWVKL